MREFIYKLFRLEYERSFCASCERLMLLLEDEKRRHDRLLAAAVLTKPVEQTSNLPPDWQPKAPRHTPWAVTRQKFEQADKIKAEEIRQAQALIDNKKRIENLEKEVGIPTMEEEVARAENE